MLTILFLVISYHNLFSQKYRITKRVGGGSFGDIYLGVGANGEKVCLVLFSGVLLIGLFLPSCRFNRILLACVSIGTQTGRKGQR